MPAAKQAVMNLLQALPDECTLEDIQYHLHVLSKLQQGEVRIATEAAIPQHEAEWRFNIDSPELVTLSKRDWAVFIKSLDATDTPRPKLAAAMQRHKEWQKS